jgi:hypothetical protein
VKSDINYPSHIVLLPRLVGRVYRVESSPQNDPARPPYGWQVATVCEPEISSVTSPKSTGPGATAFTLIPLGANYEQAKDTIAPFVAE